MESSEGQRYVANLFFGGVSADVDPEMLDSKSGEVLECHCMQVSNVAKSKLQKMRGDVWFKIIGTIPSATIRFIGGVWLAGYVVHFYRDSISHITYIYANNILIGQHADYFSDDTNYLDIDTNDETTELYITDNVNCPIVLKLLDMLAANVAGLETDFMLTVRLRFIITLLSVV